MRSCKPCLCSEMYNTPMKILSLLTLLLGALVVIALAVYAWNLWQGVWRRDSESVVRKASAHEDQVNSVRVLAKSLLDGDLNLSEGAIRLKVLLDHLQPDGSGQRDYPDVYALHDAIAHMPRGAARKACSRAELRAMDNERERLEAQYREQVLLQAGGLLEAYPD